MSIHFIKTFHERTPLLKIDVSTFERDIEDGISLLEEVLETIRSRERGVKLSSEALLILHAISESYLTRRLEQLEERILIAIKELEDFKAGIGIETKNAEDILERIASSTIHELSTISFKAKESMEVHV